MMLLYAVLAILLVCCFSCIKPSNYPPGPKWFPFIGCLPLFYALKKKLGYNHLAFHELSKQYGPIVGLKLGKQPIVVISSYDVVKKALMMDELNGRPNNFFTRVRAFGKEKGILFTQGSVWQQQRRFTMRHFKLFGLTTEKIANQSLIREAQNIINSLEKQSRSGAVPMNRVFDVGILNSTWDIIAGRTFDFHDEKLKEILHCVHEVFKLTDGTGGLLSNMPVLRYIAPKAVGYDTFLLNLHKLWKFLGSEIDDHEATLPVDQPRDLIDAYLMEIKTRASENNANSDFDRENLLILCLDLFLASVKTTADTLEMIFSFLALNPHWVKELQQDIDSVVGRDRKPTAADIPSLPKVEAFLAEALRYLVLAPNGLPHYTMKDVQLNEYKIPKNTIIMMNFYSVNNDESQWENPQEFRPERFLDKDGKFHKPPAYMAFSIGKRRCVGEHFARYSIFLFVTHILHHFDMKAAPGYDPPSLEGIDGFLIAPKQFHILFKPRN